MITYQVRVRINQYQTADIQIQAPNDFVCKQLVESMYGAGSCLNYTSSSVNK